MQATSAPQKRGWFGRKNKAATPTATNEPAAPGTPAATAGAPGTGTATDTPAVGSHTATGTALINAHDAAVDAQPVRIFTAHVHIWLPSKVALMAACSSGWHACLVVPKVWMASLCRHSKWRT